MHIHSRLPQRETRWIYLLVVFAAAMQWMGATARAQSVEARIAGVKGAALRYNNQRIFTLAKGDVLQPGEEIDTRGGGRVTIELTDGSIVIVQPNSHIIINDYRNAPSLRELFRIVLGRVRVKIKHYVGKPNPYRVNSPTASILVRGTVFDVAVEFSGDTRVVVYQGLVEVESLSDPRRRALVSPGRGVLVRLNEDIRFFTPGSGGEINQRSNGSNGINRFAEQSVDTVIDGSGNLRTILANDYERYIESIVEPGQSPPLLRFTAFPESHFDSLDNPAYSTEFMTMEGRVWLMPSLSNAQGSIGEDPLSGAGPLSPLDFGYLAQGTFFLPLERARMVIGGAFAGSGSRLQSSIETNVTGLPTPIYPDGVPGVRRIASSTETNSMFGALMAARRFGSEGRTSIGAGVDWVSGHGALLGLTSLTNKAGVRASEQLEASSEINRMRFLGGLTHEFEGGHKLGLLYRHGLTRAEDRDHLRLFNGLPLSLDSVVYEGRSSEVGIRLRGPITRRLFYGLEGSWLHVKLVEQIRRAIIEPSTERERITRADLSLGLGYALRRRTVFSADFAFGVAEAHEKHYENSTGNQLEDNRRQIHFASAHLGLQTDVWRQLFASASVLAIRQAKTTELKLYPDIYGRRLTNYGLTEPDGITRETPAYAFSDFGVGWRFNSNWLAQYLVSVNYDVGAPRHIFMLRYTFKREK